MKYMLLMQGPKSGWDSFNTMRPEEIRAHIAFMKDLNVKLAQTGELVDAQGLSLPDQAKVVQAQADGPVVITDGPFPEAKEFLAGYWILECENLERALAIAARISLAPGKDGAPVCIPVQVRPIASAPPDLG